MDEHGEKLIGKVGMGFGYRPRGTLLLPVIKGINLSDVIKKRNIYFRVFKSNIYYLHCIVAIFCIHKKLSHHLKMCVLLRSEIEMNF